MPPARSSQDLGFTVWQLSAPLLLDAAHSTAEAGTPTDARIVAAVPTCSLITAVLKDAMLVSVSIL